jgi:uncharacterized protein YcaQ
VSRASRSIVVTAAEARRTLLRLQALADPPPRSSPKAVQAMVDALGYVQIDSINVVDRAQHLILGARLDGYSRTHLAHALETTRGLFEHWTHDACAIPSKWYGHWKHRFAEYEGRVKRNAWWRGRLGPDPQKVIRATLARVARDGPLRARDFEKPEGASSGGWWEWHPEKAALEHLWRQGKLAIARRDRFEKVYDLSTRVFPRLHAERRSGAKAHVEWACHEAFARLGIATPLEVSRFFHAVSPHEARVWCAQAVKDGRLVEVVVESETREVRAHTSLALPSWRAIARDPITSETRLIAPFDPVIRDRARAHRLWGIKYRFEAFVPEAKRVYGYYTLPILEGDRIVGLIDPRLDRESETLHVRGPWWLRDRAPSIASRRGLDRAIDRLARQVGATKWQFAHSRRAACVEAHIESGARA